MVAARPPAAAPPKRVARSSPTGAGPARRPPPPPPKPPPPPNGPPRTGGASTRSPPPCQRPPPRGRDAPRGAAGPVAGVLLRGVAPLDAAAWAGVPAASRSAACAGRPRWVAPRAGVTPFAPAVATRPPVWANPNGKSMRGRMAAIWACSSLAGTDGSCPSPLQARGVPRLTHGRVKPPRGCEPVPRQCTS